VRVALAHHGVGHVRGPDLAVLLVGAVHPREDHVDLEVDVDRVVGEHVLDRGPGEAEALHGAAHGLGHRDGAPGQRVLDGQPDLVLAELPQLHLHTGAGAVVELGLRGVVGPEQPQHPGVAAGGQLAVGQQLHGLLLGVHRLDVVRLAHGRVHQGLPQAGPVLEVHGDDGSLVVAPHQQVVDARGVQDPAQEQQVLDHDVVRGLVRDPQGEAVLVADDVLALVQGRGGGAGRRAEHLAVRAVLGCREVLCAEQGRVDGASS
jgi:hypothetical protein